jgi:UDP-N-acetylglucosamine 1-carboxyvinyltransferase
MQESRPFLIRGQQPLTGAIEVLGAKNSALAILAGALAIPGKHFLRDVPRIVELERFREIFEALGCQWERTSTHSLRLEVPEKLALEKLPIETAKKTRAVLLLAGALVARGEKRFRLPFSGGCQLGKRTVAPHLYALEKLGVRVRTGEDFWEFLAEEGRKGASVVLSEAGDTTTSNALLAAVGTPGKTTIRFASANYSCQDLAFFLRERGARISGIGTTTLEIEGGATLSAGEYAILNDPIEAFSFLSLAATTGSGFEILGVPRQFVELELEKLDKMGWRPEILRERRSRSGNFALWDLKTPEGKAELRALPDKIDERPFPGLNSDNLPVFAPIATQAFGTTMLHDWMYENRAVYLVELQRLGAAVKLLDPHRVEITGPTELRGAEVVCPAMLRAGMVLLIAMLAASGDSILRNTTMLERGYENLPERLRALGAEICRKEN